MGIKNLSKYLRENHPELFETIHLSEYAFKRVAIDTSLYLCQYKASCGDEGWLGAFVRLVSVLRQNEVHCVFIYDTSSPPEKDAEKKEREEARDKMEARVCQLEDALDQYHSTGQISPCLLELQTKRKLGQPSLISGRSILNINGLEATVKSMRKQLFTITPQDFETTRQLFDLLRVPYFMAPMEAETMCADLCIQGKVDAVLSEDTDVLAYGAPTFLTKIDTGEASCVRISYQAVLEKFEMTPDQFLDFCLMCGTDYNKNIFRVGPSKAYQFISSYKSIEEIAKKTRLDVSILNHTRGRELFRDYQKSKVKVPYCGVPDEDGLRLFMTKKNIRANVETLMHSFVRKDKIVVENDDVVIIED